mmetsp:Transcript_69403/g.166398  ORF Transcript_69403/g.166398 Transcript_69403/m.166398 type:complete len:373 (+) Transcript_69403:113-1231(+)|eukprot:CAMPEP_0178405000 /NCGR_PEP_ID=MMETSP0689_2-20121128/18176_1 /TAXON_ID=160604 /ORGANISM="Amphidinium massartii, Strain CS-259" /LENGTH=372 /DNA_ID=CAMNT_0020026007 /DNA_START=23 /DNA_END=1141 /DNA_ORIENTATION=-
MAPEARAILASAQRFWKGSRSQASSSNASAAAKATEVVSPAAQHVVILQHGIIGRPKDLKRVEKTMLATLGSSTEASPGTEKPQSLRIVNSKVNVGKTLDGVARGGKRLANLIRESVPAGCCLSLVCHSLGGLYGRYALRELEEERWFAQTNVQGLNFITLATPHVGIMEILAPLRHLIGIGRCIVGQTLLDLALQSPVLGKDLVDDLALQSLQRFKHLAAYGNIFDDHMVGAGTSLIVAAVPNRTPHPIGVPQQCSSSNVDDVEVLSKCFKSKKTEVHYMLQRLSTLPWSRYSLRFQRGYLPWDNAHVKICLHCPQDRSRHGESVILHMCSEFTLEADSDLLDHVKHVDRQLEDGCEVHDVKPTVLGRSSL